MAVQSILKIIEESALICSWLNKTLNEVVVFSMKVHDLARNAQLESHYPSPSYTAILCGASLNNAAANVACAAEGLV